MEDFLVTDKAAKLCLWRHKMWRNQFFNLLYSLENTKLKFYNHAIFGHSKHSNLGDRCPDSFFIDLMLIIISLSGIRSILIRKLLKSILHFRGKVKLSFPLLWLQDSLGYLTTLRMTFITPFYHVLWERSQTRHLKERKDVRRVLQVTVNLFFSYLACMSGACLQSFTGVELAHSECRPEQDPVMGAWKCRLISITWILHKIS